MAIFGSEPTHAQILLSYIYHYVILAAVFSLVFVYYLFRTRAPLKEEDESSQGAHSEGHESEGEKEKVYRNGPTASAILANGNVEVAEGDKELLKTILNGMITADDAEEAHDDHKGTRSRKATENEEGEDDRESPARRRQVIREVTVRKIFLPQDARYSDVETAAKRLIGDAQTTISRKDSGTGGVEFRTAIKNIREASKRLEDDDLSPVRNSSG